ncbi:44825_t:CDS:2, partial [Gigaspora margarita]
PPAATFVPPIYMEKDTRSDKSIIYFNMSCNWSSYFNEARPEDYRFLDFYNYRSQQTDFTFSFQKESDKLKKDLKNLIINGSDKQKKGANQLNENFKLAEGDFHNYGGHLLAVHLTVCLPVVEKGIPHNYGGHLLAVHFTVCLPVVSASSHASNNALSHDMLTHENASRSIMNNTTKVLGTAIENVHYTIENINDALTNPRKRTSLTHDITTKFIPESIKKVKTTQTDGRLEASNESSSKPLKILSTGSFVDLKQRSGYYLDKTHFISKIENLNAQAILSLRPRRFGKTLFLSTLSSYYDIKNQGDQFKQLFGDLFIGKNPTPLASSFLVLELNFSGIRTSATYAIFEESFHKRLNLFMSRFMYRYQQELGHHFQIVDENSDALTNLLRLLNAIGLCGYKLYICIDEYDASINEILRDETTACDRGIAYVFQTGVTPVAMSEFTSGFNISTDLALSEEFWDLHGFKQSEVELLLDNALGNNLPSDVKKGIVKWLKEENDGYFFNPNQAEGIFNTARILYCIRMLIGQIKFTSYGEDSSNIIKKFLRFPPDPNTLPSQTILELIGNNPLGKSILTEALNRSPLESRNGIEQRFRLTSIRELATDRNPLLSFMFYTGALTYQPNSLRHMFRIPNRVSEREFIAEALKIYDWKEEDLIPVRSCLQILEAECNIEPLCRFVEETLLKPLKDNSVKHSNEEALKQSFMNQSFGMEYINLNGAQGTWQEATLVSRSLMTKLEDEILSLEISDPYRPDQKIVCEALEWKIKKKRKEYLEPLKNDMMQ